MKMHIDLHDEHCTKNTKCRHFAVMFMLKNYVFTSDKDPNFYNDTYNEYCNMPNYPGHFISFDSKPPRYASAVINFAKFGNYKTYFNSLPNNVKRDYYIAEKRKYIFKQFRYENYIPDICELHHSNLKRKKKMNPFYLRSIEEMGGAPKVELNVEPPQCELHHTSWYGVFRYLKNYKQGDIKTNKKLIAYTGIARDGNLACVTFISGHNDYLKYGTMFYLLINTIKIMFEMDNLKCLQYWSLSNLEKSSIISWKKRLQFEAANLFAKPIKRGV